MFVKRIAIAFVALAIAGCGQQGEPDLAEILKRHADARGGAAAIEAVRAVEIEVQIAEPNFQVDGRYRATRDGKMRIDVVVDGQRVFSEGFDGTRGWQLPANETAGTDMSPEGEAAVKRGIVGNLYGLHELTGLGHTVTLRGREKIDDTDYWVVDATFADGFERRYFLDPETYLIARVREESALHPDVNPEEKRFETRPGDYRAVNGVLFGFKSEKRDLESGAVVQTDVTKTIAMNPQIDPAIFLRPE